MLLALVALFFWRFLTPRAEDRVAFPGGDFTDQFYAWRLYEGRALADGRLPLWGPEFNSGHPFLADAQAAVFYPISLAVTWLGSLGGDLPVEAVQYEALVHYFLAGFFTYLLVLRLLRRRSAASGRPRAGYFGALVAAVTFAFGGYLTSYPPLQLAVLETVTWLPLFLLALDAAAERPGARPVAGAAAALALAVFAGHTQTLLFVLYAGALYYAFRCWDAAGGKAGEPALSPWSFAAGRLAVFAAIIGLGAALSAVQLLPTLEYVALSTRSGLGFVESATGMPPLQLVQLLVPGSVSAFSSPLYVGILPLWLAVSAVAARRDRYAGFWLTLAALAVLDMLGGFSFFYGVVYTLAPGFAFFRGQERAACLFSFALAVLAGYGADAFAHRLPRRPKAGFLGAFRVLAWAPLAALILTLFFFWATKASANPGAFVFLVDRAALLAMLCVMAAAVAAARLWGWLRPRQTRLLVVALIVFDLFTINWYNNQAPVMERFPVTPPVQAMQADTGLFRIDGDALPGHAGVVYGLQDIRGISPLRLRSYDDLLRNLPADRLRALLGVRYLVSGDEAPAGAVRLAGGDDAAPYRLSIAFPRAWLVTDVRVEPDAAKRLATLAGGGVDLSHTVILEREPSLLPGAGSPGTARVTAYAPERLVVETASGAPAILVVSENHYPGWRATVDGSPAEILRADHALRAVAVPAGSHTVEMAYEPVSLRLGAAITVVAALLAVALAWHGRRRSAGAGWGR